MPIVRSRDQRVLAILEVLAAFVCVHVTYRAIKQLTPIGACEAASGSNFTPGLVMIAFTTALLLLHRSDLKTYGLTLQRWQNDLSLGLVCTFVILPLFGLGLVVSGFAFDPTRPPDPHENPAWVKLLVLVPFLAVGFIATLGVVDFQGRRFQAIPAYISIPLIIGLLATPPLGAIYLQRPSNLPTVLWLFFGAGFGEEIFYRGYIQSRVDQSFGRPCRWHGFEFGMGLLISSLLFGLLHVLNTVDYFHGRFDFNWRMGIESVFTGLLFGLIRARTGSVLPGAILHGLEDVLVRIPSFLLS